MYKNTGARAPGREMCVFVLLCEERGWEENRSIVLNLKYSDLDQISLMYK